MCYYHVSMIGRAMLVCTQQLSRFYVKSINKITKYMKVELNKDQIEYLMDLIEIKKIQI